MKVQDGLWTLTPGSNGKTRLAYRAIVLSKFAVPRGIVKRAMRKDVPDIFPDNVPLNIGADFLQPYHQNQD